MRPAPIQAAIDKAGSVKALAEIVGVKPQAISQWTRIPAEQAMKINQSLHVPLHEMRPDLWVAGSAA